MPGIVNDKYRRFVRLSSGSGFSKLFLKSRRHRFASQKHLITARLKDAANTEFSGGFTFRTAIAACFTGFGILIIIRENIDKLYDKIRIGSARRRNEKRGFDVTRHRYIFVRGSV